MVDKKYLELGQIFAPVSTHAIPLATSASTNAYITIGDITKEWVGNVDANGFDLKDLSNIEFRTTTGAPAGTVQAIYADAGGIKYNVPTGDTHQFKVNGVNIIIVSNTQIDLTNHNILMGSGVIQFSSAVTSLQDAAGDLQYDVDAAQVHQFRVSDVTEMTLSATTLDIDAKYLELESIVAPAATAAATIGRIFMDSGNSNHLSIRRNGASVDLEAGGAITFTDAVLCTMEVPEGTVAFPDIHALATAGAKVSGMVLPDGAATSTINFKCRVPRDLAGTPAMKIRLRIMTLAADTAHAIRLVVATNGVAINENLDAALTAETEVTAEMPDAIETMNEAVIEIDLTTDWAADDTVIGQVTRDPTDVVDDYAGNVLLVGVELLVDRTIS